MNYIEHITSDGKSLCIIIRAGINLEKTVFLTPLDFNLQLGFIVYPAQGEISRHTHPPLERKVSGTSEVLVVQRGRCEIDIYSDDHMLIETRELGRGDIAVIVAGGHGFRLLEDTTLLEVKQGPYIGVADKTFF